LKASVQLSGHFHILRRHWDLLTSSVCPARQNLLQSGCLDLNMRLRRAPLNCVGNDNSSCLPLKKRINPLQPIRSNIIYNLEQNTAGRVPVYPRTNQL
jgi:hypothetical protein